MTERREGISSVPAEGLAAADSASLNGGQTPFELLSNIKVFAPQ